LVYVVESFNTVSLKISGRGKQIILCAFGVKVNDITEGFVVQQFNESQDGIRFRLLQNQIDCRSHLLFIVVAYL